jgi:hypothetical protein
MIQISKVLILIVNNNYSFNFFVLKEFRIYLNKSFELILCPFILVIFNNKIKLFFQNIDVLNAKK